MKTKIFAVALCFMVCLSVTAPALAGFDLNEQLDETGKGLYGDTGNAPDSEALPKIIGNIIAIVLGFLGVILVIIVIYAGFMYMTAGGKSEQVDKAKAWLVNGIIGLIIILLAYAITQFVVNRLMEATTG